MPNQILSSRRLASYWRRGDNYRMTQLGPTAAIKASAYTPAGKGTSLISKFRQPSNADEAVNP
jgi:hypothetical protein